MQTPYSPLALANEFIERAGEHGIEHMKLQKLVHITNGWWLAYRTEPLLNEQPEVWKYGPVFASLYNVLKEFGRTPILTKQKDNPFEPEPVIEKGSEDKKSDEVQLIDWIWQRYGAKSAFELSDITHQRNSPWRKVVEKLNSRVPFHTKIPDDVIREHYKGLKNELTANAR